ncbi:hypothetical protein [Mucilaginibacter terrae]|uniref:Uncharacterized protein n=1 Tax=Mucilaginibacter terrae TaxID=1955052 RepID=A0ABU3GYF5_9SPHI|nr:hypothetical protein [Mucilaginibacter terrae]MDT3404017.1 hypothetical protein [Mucilaginibacter terrae]
MKKICVRLFILLTGLNLSTYAQIGKRFPSERKIVKDPVTGTMLTFFNQHPCGRYQNLPNSPAMDIRRPVAGIPLKPG